MVATLTELQKDGGESGGLMSGGGTDVSTQGAWSGISTTTFVVASLILLGLFSTGLFVFPPRLPGVHVNDLVQMGPAAVVHSKPA